MKKRMAQGFRFNEWAVGSIAGDYSFDPLNLATDKGVTDRYELQEAEMINGRLAMIAVLAYAMIESQMEIRIVDVFR